MRFKFADYESNNAITVEDTETGKLYLIMGEEEDFEASELRFLFDLLNAGALYEVKIDKNRS